MIAAILAAAAVSGAPATYPTLRFGIGTLSCATWLSTPYLKREGDVWVMGFWSGLNGATVTYRLVGHDTDAEGIIGEVAKICGEQPSLDLADAALKSYIKLAVDGR